MTYTQLALAGMTSREDPMPLVALAAARLRGGVAPGTVRQGRAEATGIAPGSVDTVVLRTWLLRRKTYWTAYAIVVFFQLITNGILTGFDIVRYDPDAILGWRIAFAPVEDILFGYAMVLLTLSTWVWLGRRGVRT